MKRFQPRHVTLLLLLLLVIFQFFYFSAQIQEIKNKVSGNADIANERADATLKVLQDHQSKLNGINEAITAILSHTK